MKLQNVSRLVCLVVSVLLCGSHGRDSTSRVVFLTPEEKDIVTTWAAKKGLNLSTGDLSFELGSIDDAFENTMFDYLIVWSPAESSSKLLNTWRVRQTQITTNVLPTNSTTMPTPTGSATTASSTGDSTTENSMTKRQLPATRDGPSTRDVPDQANGHVPPPPVIHQLPPVTTTPDTNVPTPGPKRAVPDMMQMPMPSPPSQPQPGMSMPPNGMHAEMPKRATPDMMPMSSSPPPLAMPQPGMSMNAEMPKRAVPDMMHMASSPPPPAMPMPPTDMDAHTPKFVKRAVPDMMTMPVPNMMPRPVPNTMPMLTPPMQTPTKVVTRQVAAKPIMMMTMTPKPPLASNGNTMQPPQMMPMSTPPGMRQRRAAEVAGVPVQPLCHCGMGTPMTRFTRAEHRGMEGGHHTGKIKRQECRCGPPEDR